MMKNKQGSKTFKDLSKDSQYYYDKLIQYFNDKSNDDDECIQVIEWLDALIDNMN